jgi:hypothetical protein
VEESEGVGQSATVGQSEVGQPTAVDLSGLEQVGQSAPETQAHHEEVAAE